MYKDLLRNAKGKRDIDSIKSKAIGDNIEIKDNSYFVAQAERQCVNARIQGGAATLTKLAMIKIHNDEVLKRLGFRLSIAVHDELIGECPIEN
jgi:DNA polymerase I-like protein with 3'-5' exonuclease and polymerase domains